jgi:hypothetical protein
VNPQPEPTQAEPVVAAEEPREHRKGRKHGGKGREEAKRPTPEVVTPPEPEKQQVTKGRAGELAPGDF